MYDNIQTQPRPLWNFTRLLAWHFSPTPGEAALGATDPTGPVGPGADSFETFWVPKRCDLSRPFGDLSDRSWLGILCTQGFDFLLLKNIQRAWDKREAGELEAVICSGKSPYFWIELKPHCVVLRKSRLRYQPLATLRAFAAISQLTRRFNSHASTWCAPPTVFWCHWAAKLTARVLWESPWFPNPFDVLCFRKYYSRSIYIYI